MPETKTLIRFFAAAVGFKVQASIGNILWNPFDQDLICGNWIPLFSAITLSLSPSSHLFHSLPLSSHLSHSNSIFLLLCLSLLLFLSLYLPLPMSLILSQPSTLSLSGTLTASIKAIKRSSDAIISRNILHSKKIRNTKRKSFQQNLISD